MKLLFISTSLQLHIKQFSNSFSDGERDYSLSDQEVKEYLANQPDLHFKGICYRLLNPEYYIWIRKQVCKVVELYQSNRLTIDQIKETRENWKIIHQYAIDNFTSQQIKNTLDDIQLQTQEGVYKYQIPVYDSKKESCPTHKSANNKQNTSYQQSNRLCPGCSPILNFVSVKETEKLLQYNCFICNDYCSHEPKSTEIQIAESAKKIDNFANVKPYCTIETIDNKTVYTYSSAIPNEQSEPLAGGNLSFSRSPSAAGAIVVREGNLQLSDLSNLSWLEIVSILRSIDKNTKGQNRQVNALLGYYQPIREDRPNIGMETGLLKFLDNCREIVKGLIQEGLYVLDSQ